MHTERLRRFMRILVTDGLQIDLTGSLISHKHTEIDRSAAPPPMKLNLCREELRPEGRLLPGDILEMGHIMWLDAKQHGFHEDIRALASIPRVGDEIAQALRLAAANDGYAVPIVQFEKVEKGPHFFKVQNETLCPHHYPLKIIDDLTHKSLSKQRMIRAVRQAGYETNGVFVFLDYGQGARELITSMNIPFHAVLELRDLLRFGYDEGILPTHTYDVLMNYLETTRGAAT